MPHSHVTPAIVLRSWPFGESDEIVCFLTENHGKVTGIAKGAKRSRRRFVNSLEPFSLVNLRFQDRPQSNLVLIIASDLARSYKQLASSLEKISFASYMVEITDGVVGEREESCVIFRHLRDGLSYLDENRASLRFLTAFELKLLQLAGYQPWLENCKRCGKNRSDTLTDRWYFSPKDGGIFCQSCSQWTKEIISIAAKALEILADLQAEKNVMSPCVLLPSSVVKEVRSAVQRFIQFHIDREIKSAAFLNDLSAGIEPHCLSNGNHNGNFEK
jgi:DNA repair protein RecO (recombination protein O)